MTRYTLARAALAMVSVLALFPRPSIAAEPTAGIQWFATLEPALASAKQTGRPILFLTAAPHCGGVSGAW